MKNCLQSNVGLTSLTICDGRMFDEDFSSEIGFKLEKFKTGFEGLYQVNQKHLNLFLKTQKDTIKTLKLSKWMGFDVLETISSMNCLTELHLSTREIEDMDDSQSDDTDDSQIETEDFPQNNSVLRLELSFTSSENALVKNLLKTFPKIQFLKVLSLTDAVAGSISETCECLKILYTRYFFLKNVANEAFFLNLEKRICRNDHSYDSGQMFERLRFERSQKE